MPAVACAASPVCRRPPRPSRTPEGGDSGDAARDVRRSPDARASLRRRRRRQRHDPGSFGERLAIEALRSPRRRAVHLVHPTHASVQGRPCRALAHRRPRAGRPRAAGSAGPRLWSTRSRLAAARGDGGAVVFGSAVGLARSAARRRRRTCRSWAAGAWASSTSPAGCAPSGTWSPPTSTPGPIALVTHSGSVFSAMLRTHRRLEYSLVVSSGQELVTTAADYLDYALDLPETEVVGLFLETMRDVPRLRAAFAACRRRRTSPSSRSPSAPRRPASSLVAAHSGALAGGDGAWEALLRAYGVHRVRDLDELVDTLELFAAGAQAAARAHAASPRCTTREASACSPRTWRSALGVPFAPLAPDTTARLAAVLDPGSGRRATRSTSGAPARTPSSCWPPASPRSPTTRRWPSPRWRSTWSRSTTATSPTRGGAGARTTRPTHRSSS